MELMLKHQADEGTLYATLSGYYSLAEAERTFLQILEGLAQYKVQKVVVDGRAITGEPTSTERYLYGEFVARSVITLLNRTTCPVPQFAYVLTPPVLDPRRLGEIVAVNRGMFVKAFDNLTDGLKWLGIDSGNEAMADSR